MKTSNHYANRATFFPTSSYKFSKYDINELVTPLEKPVLNDLGKCLVGKSSPKDRDAKPLLTSKRELCPSASGL